MARYGKKAQKKVKKAMHERKRGTLKSGRSGKKVKSRKQAIAIGLSEARRSGAKVPRKKTGKKEGILAEAEVAPGRLFRVMRRDLLKEPVDAIVNATARATKKPGLSMHCVPHGRARRSAAGSPSRFPLRNVRLCLRDQAIIDAVLKEMNQ